MRTPDPAPNAQGQNSLAGLWSLMWHTVVLAPLALALFAVCCYAWMGLAALPAVAGICLWHGDSRDALLCMALWPVCLVCVRWFWRRERSEPGRHWWL